MVTFPSVSGGWSVVESWGSALRSCRCAAGVDLGALAAAVHYSKALICNVEAGRRAPTADFARACDEALGTTPLLSLLWDLEHTEGDTMRRRAFGAMVATAAATIGLGGAPAMAEVVRAGLGMGDPEDWDQVVADHERRMVVDPGPAFAASLQAHLLVAQRAVTEVGATPERLRAMARLAQLQGLLLGNQDQVPGALGWYRTAAAVADRSGDTATRVFVRARTASRAPYEGSTARETVRAARGAIAISDRPSPGSLEAHAALVHVHALTGELVAGREAVAGMRDVADALGDTSAAGAHVRALQFASYLECRIGPFTAAERAYAAVEPLLRPLPVWWADATIYRARAHVTAGHVRDGLAMALDAIRSVPPVRVLRVGARDVLDALPPGTVGDDVDELAGHAAADAPWRRL